MLQETWRSTKTQARHGGYLLLTGEGKKGGTPGMILS